MYAHPPLLSYFEQSLALRRTLEQTSIASPADRCHAHVFGQPKCFSLNSSTCVSVCFGFRRGCKQMFRRNSTRGGSRRELSCVRVLCGTDTTDPAYTRRRRAPCVFSAATATRLPSCPPVVTTLVMSHERYALHVCKRPCYRNTRRVGAGAS